MTQSSGTDSTYIERLEKFDRAKRTMLWFAIATIAVAFSDRISSATQPLLGIHVPAMWLGFFLLIATLYSAWPFYHYLRQVTGLNAKRTFTDTRDLDRFQQEVIARLEELSRALEESRDSTNTLVERAETEWKETTEWLKLQRPPRWAVDDDEVRKTSDILAGNLLRLPKDAGPLEGPYSVEINGTFGELISRLAEGRLQHEVSEQVIVTVRNSVGSIQEHEAGLAAARARIDALPAFANEFRQLKDNLAGGERALHEWHDARLPKCALAGALIIGLWSFSIDAWSCARSGEGCLPLLSATGEFVESVRGR